MLTRGDIFGLRFVPLMDSQQYDPGLCATRALSSYERFLNHGYDAHETCAPQRARIRNVAMPS